MPDRTCTVEGCERPPRTSKADLCPMHYHRLYRHGDVNAVAVRSGITASHGRRYKLTYVGVARPLADKQGRTYEHRAVLYQQIGYGPHVCHWCQQPISWGAKGKGQDLQVDHLNGLGDDNRTDNLVPACCACNTARGQQARSRALRAAGFWSEHDTIAHLTTRGRRPTIEAA